MDIYTILIFISIGLAAGFLSGFLGIGGGVIIIPALMYYLKDKIPEENLFLTVSTLSICAVLISAANSAYRHIRAGNYYKESVLPLALGALTGPVPGNYLCGIVEDKTRIIFFSATMIILSIRVIFQKDGSEKREAVLKAVPLFLCGMFMGVITAMTGIGGGAVLVPLLTVLLDFDIKKAVGVTSVIMIFNSLSFLAGRMMIGGFADVPLYLSALMILVIGTGIMMSSGLGVKLHLKSKESTFRYVSGAVFISVSVIMITKAL